MKVTRLKSGYRIALSDSDYELLDEMIGSVERDDPDILLEMLSPRAKAAWTRRQRATGNFILQVDEDRRHEA